MILGNNLIKVTAVFTAAWGMLACSSFQGPGSYRASHGEYRNGYGEYRTADEYPNEFQQLPPDGITWRSARKLGAPQSEVRFDWPVDQARLTQGFQPGRKVHWGIDLAGKKGTPILAAEDGVVVYTGSGFRGYGKLVVIEHGTEWATLYSHLSSIKVKEGQKVRQGQKIGGMGRTGRASGVHLHFEVRKNRQPVNPLALLPNDASSLAQAN
jgi:murein DD-endopeptidase MepM/ murein hydrolase activator NlpD